MKDCFVIRNTEANLRLLPNPTTPTDFNTDFKTNVSIIVVYKIIPMNLGIGVLKSALLVVCYEKIAKIDAYNPNYISQ